MKEHMSDRDAHDRLTAHLESHGERAAILRLKGEIDISSAPILAEQLDAITRRDLGDVILDATNVTFMDSTGLHALVKGERAIHENETRMYLVSSQQVQRVLELVLPDPLFAARVDSVDEALAAMDGNQGRDAS